MVRPLAALVIVLWLIPSAVSVGGTPPPRGSTHVDVAVAGRGAVAGLLAADARVETALAAASRDDSGARSR